MSHVIGIDLGTANSCVALVKDGNVIVLPDADGNRTTPSVFALNNNRTPLVGYQALRQADVNRTNTIFAAKRLIGRIYKSPEVEEFSQRVPFSIIPAANGDAWVDVSGQSMSPEEISAFILKEMRAIAENHLGEPVQHAVITVPAHFNDSQRQATKDAGKIAGLNVLSIINEPTAAALAYGMDITDKQNYNPLSGNTNGATAQTDRVIAVFDLGSGTFDVTILALRNGVFDVLATGGDTYLGGEDFDLALMDYLIAEFKRAHNIDLSADRAVLQRLKDAAKQAKQALSSSFSYDVVIPYLAPGKQGAAATDLRVSLDRKTFEKIVQPLLDRLEEPCLQAMEDAGLNQSNIDDCILVGGMTRMPAVKNHCQRIFGKTPIDTIDPDEAVARGAAIQAGLLQGVLKGLQLADVTSLSLGIEVQGGKLVTLLPRNSKIPARVSRVFTTSAPDQTEVTIHLVQGESNFVTDNKSLGRFELTGIPRARRGHPRIEVTLEVDRDGIVHLEATDRETKERKTIEIINSSGLSDEELNALVNDSRREAAHKQRQAERERQQQGDTVTNPGETSSGSGEEPSLESARLKLRNLIFETQFRLDSQGKNLRGTKRESLESALSQARKILQESATAEEAMHEFAKLAALVEELGESLGKI